MKKEQIMELEGMKVTDEQFCDIEESECVADVQNNGNSGIDPDLTWYTVAFEDGDEIDIYG